MNKTKTMRQRWIDSFGDDMELWRLEKNDEMNVRLYETKPHDNSRSPVYHVWQGDEKWVATTTNYFEALNKYNSVVNGGE